MKLLAKLILFLLLARNGVAQSYADCIQVERFIKEGVGIYLKQFPTTYIIHVNVHVDAGFTRLEFIATETNVSFSRVRYQQIRPYERSYLLIESNRFSCFNQDPAKLHAYKLSISNSLKKEEELTNADSSIEESRHMIYEPLRLMMHYDGEKLITKKFIPD